MGHIFCDTFTDHFMFFGHGLHVDNTVRRRLTAESHYVWWRHRTVPCVLSVGSISSGSFPPALGAETLPRRVPIISTGILTQQLLLRNSDPSLFIRRRPHCGHCFPHELVRLIGRNRKVPNATKCFCCSLSLASFTSLASPTCSRTS